MPDADEISLGRVTADAATMLAAGAMARAFA
jgi:hypothetical protein